MGSSMKAKSSREVVRSVVCPGTKGHKPVSWEDSRCLLCEREKLRRLRGRQEESGPEWLLRHFWPGNRVYLVVHPELGVDSLIFPSKREAQKRVSYLASKAGLVGYLVEGPFVRQP